MQQTLTYRSDPTDEVSYEAIRITVKTLTVGQIGAHARLTQQVQNQWQVDNNLPPEGPIATPPDPSNTISHEAQLYLYQYKRWVTCYVATVGVQVVERTKKLTLSDLDDDNPETWPWAKSSLTALGLDKPEGILNIKSDLLDAWEIAAMTVNPGVFGGQNLTASPKKKTGLIATG
jgi:hypothetical protein